MIKFKVQRTMLEEKLKGTHTKWGIIKICFSIGFFVAQKLKVKRYGCKKGSTESHQHHLSLPQL